VINDVPRYKDILCLIKRHATKTYGQWRYSSTHS